MAGGGAGPRSVMRGFFGSSDWLPLDLDGWGGDVAEEGLLAGGRSEDLTDLDFDLGLIILSAGAMDGWG